MTTTPEQLAAMMEGESRMMSMGARFSQHPQWQVDELRERRTLACRISTLTGSPCSTMPDHNLRQKLAQTLRAIRAGTLVPMDNGASTSTKNWMKRLGIELQPTK